MIRNFLNIHAVIYFKIKKKKETPFLKSLLCLLPYEIAGLIFTLVHHLII